MSLPSSYKKLQYIQSSGTQYIDTGFKHNQNTRIVMHVQPVSITANAWAFEGRISYTNASKGVFFYYDSGKQWNADYNGSGNRKTLAGISSTADLTIDYNKNICTINGVSITNTATTFQSTANLTLLACNTAGTIAGFLSAKLYSCKIYDNGTLVRDFIPCRSANGTVGLWDDVNSVFYTNAGTGNFISGPLTSVTLPSGYRRLEYIQSSGTQYVDTLFNPTQNTQLVLDAAFLGSAGTNVAGVRNNSNDTINRFGIISFGSDSKLGAFFRDSSIKAVTLDNNRHLYDLSKDGLVFDGTSYGGANTGSFSCTYSLTLFAWNNGANGVTCNLCKVYSCQIYDNGTIARNYIPCQTTSGEIGLWDDVNSVFYGNAGTGTFIAGPFTDIKITGIKTGDILNYNYTGAVQPVTLPKGVYKLEVWGAEGGGSRLSGNSNSGLGGKGGYSVGTITLTEETNVYVYVGGAGGSSANGNAAGGFNGGGQGYASGSGEPGNGGGGASDIRIGADNLYNRVIVAGGGGGGGEDAGDAYGHGGGTSGVNGSGSVSNGTQTAAGTNGGFGVGAGTNKGDGGGGGGGWYGGGTSQSSSTGGDTQGGGGGSGYVLTASSSKPSGYALGSQYYLTNANTIAGNASMPSVSGGTETGHTGNGYARITVISIDSFNGYIKTSSGWKEISDLFVKVSINGTSIWKNADSIKIKDTSIWKNS